MSEREYIVTLKKGVDYAAFNAEMIATTGAGDIPGRSVTVADARPGSQRNTHYMLTDAEADALNNDTRVIACELRPDLRDDIEIVNYAAQTGNFNKTDDTRGTFVNWGLRRINEINNPYIGNNVTGDYNYTIDGTGVDIVIQDSGIQADHPEFQDADGASRVQEVDWYSVQSVVSGTMPTEHYTDYDGHGTHCAGIAAGKTYGWAKNAKIYAVKVAGLEGSTDPNTGIAVSQVFDIIKEWHNAKSVDPLTGAKRPTIVNMSWGYTSTFSNITGGNYRGTDWTGTTRDTAKGMIGSLRSGVYRYPTRVASVDTDVDELIDAGVHVCISAGNYKQKIDVDGGDDYDNYFTRSDSAGNKYYHRGGSPHSQEAFIVGNIDTAIANDGKEQKATSSETGPGVNMHAPGTKIFSTLSTTTVYTSGPYPEDDDYKIGSLSGTSMASPQVAGVLGLYLQLNPTATPAQALSYFKGSAKADRIYTTANNSTDYSNDRSLLGSTNRFLWNKFNSNTQLSIGSTFSEVITEEVAIRTYVLTRSAASVNEGDSVVITLTTTNVADDTLVPYTITGVSGGDFGGSLTGNFTVSNNTATKTFTFTEDFATEGNETFTLSLDGIDESVSVTVNDTSEAAQTPSYAVTSAANNVDEGSALTMNVATTNVADSTTLYWTVTNSGDFGTASGSFTITNNAGSFTVTPTADATTEGSETFTVQIRTGSITGTVVDTSDSITINDTSLTPAAATYAATPAATDIDEGSALTINVATTNVADATTLYWTVTNAGDFGTSSGSFTITSDAGSFTVTPTADATTEGAETFQVQIRTGSVSGTVVDTTDNITINDTSTFSPDYTITVTNSGNSYTLSGTDRNGAVSGSQPTLTFNDGDNVRFSVNASTASAHPFYIKTTQSTGTGNQVSGATGQGTTQVDWTTSTDGAGSYGYQCSVHFGMWNTITIS